MKSDAQIQQDVIAELGWEPSVNAAQIGVAVKEGIVTLSGHVNTFLEKWNAEKATQRVVGVRALASDLDVQLTATAHRSDAAIASAAESALEWMMTPPQDKVSVQVEKGAVKLTGTVHWQYQRQAASDVIRHLVGVQSVSNQICVEPTLTVDAVESGIEAALQRQAHADAKSINVKVQGSTVTLSGVVDSLTERQSAIHSTWNMPGVRNVVDHMRLSF
jgi:osmotically-inducible protein OsmY